MISYRCSEVLSATFMAENNIEVYEKMMALSGADFQPHLMGYKGPVS